MLRSGIVIFALFAACQANLYCFQCSWPENGNCKDGIVEYEVEPQLCPSDATHCIVTEHTTNGALTEVDRDCIGGSPDKLKEGCDGKDDGTRSCTRLCTSEDGGCNAPTPTSPPTTPTTTTTTKASGAGEVTVSRLVILAAGALTAMLCLKL